MGLPRVGMMYSKDSEIGVSLHKFAVNVMSMMGFELCETFAVSRDASESELEAAWAQFTGARPQAILLFAPISNEDTSWFIDRVVQSTKEEFMYVMVPSTSVAFLLRSWREAVLRHNGKLKPGQIIATGTHPPSVDTRFEVVQRFRKEMNSFLDSNTEWIGYAKPPHFDDDSTMGELMMLGWLTGEVLMQALSNERQLTNRTAFMESLYKQRRYLVDEFVVGDFGGDCQEFSYQQGAMCRCNQGGNGVYMKSVGEGYRLEHVREGVMMWGTSKCSIDEVIMHPFFSGLAVMLADMPDAMEPGLSWFFGATALENGVEILEQRLLWESLVLSSQVASTSLERYLDENIVTALFGCVNESFVEKRDVVLLDSFTPSPTVNSFMRNVIRLSPTLQQQLYVLAMYLSNKTPDDITVIFRGPRASLAIDALNMTLVTFGMSLKSKVVLGDEESLERVLPSSGYVFVIGLRATDAKPCAKHLVAHSSVELYVLFSDVSKVYEEFVEAFNETTKTIASAARLVFATSLPHWADRDGPSETLQKFHSAVRDPSMWSPMSLRGFMTARLLQVITPAMKKINSTLLLDYFYKESVIGVDDMRYGPFSDKECVSGQASLESDCLTNFGARDIAVWSMSRALDPTVPVLQRPVTPSLQYTNANKDQGLMPSQIAGVIIVCCVALALFIALGALLFVSLRNARDSKREPKGVVDPVVFNCTDNENKLSMIAAPVSFSRELPDSACLGACRNPLHEPPTFVFTDIESSTAQWATHPELMPDAVAAHHNIVRSLISKYDCYEVKTVGDSFMIASRSITAGVRLAQELQQSFLRYDWKTAVFDDFYRNMEVEKSEEDERYTPPTAHLDPEVYRELWSGLRVRIGIHTGLCDIRHDEVTKGYDYYGRTPNMGARTESIANGGQVLLTHAAYMALSAAERDEFDVTSLGAVSLRGVPEPVEMFQLNAVPGRRFAALRLDREHYFDEDACDGTSTSNSDHSSSRAELSESAQMIATSLQSLLGTFKAAQREKLLMPFCERWRVSLPRRGGCAWDDAYCEEVVRRIAVKVGHIAEHGAYEASGGSTVRSNSSLIVVSFDPSCLENFSRDGVPAPRRFSKGD
ncbi:unnamed protein product [Trypanosoma congolense IL3000]|uniref:adenylate cyclase n=1 Tax=Trypanosoma congolense (strain IL3000) TaxID=1068625 RepID=F9W784_TRYCI|nr:unnamed protein product [Trypanosoma congolense IL3000]